LTQLKKLRNNFLFSNDKNAWLAIAGRFCLTNVDISYSNLLTRIKADKLFLPENGYTAAFNK